jgi:hypothetical protein
MSASIDGKRVAPTGDSLRNALLSACGTNLHAYAAEKAQQLANLGFEERPYATQMTLHLGHQDDLVDMFLGLKKDVAASDLRTEQTRFGIKLPLPKLSGQKATITIQPSPADTCTITVRSDPLSAPAVFRGKVFSPGIPGLPPERRKILIEADLISMVLFRNGLTVTSEKNIRAQTPSTWASYWRLAFVMASGIGTIQIASVTKPSINATISVPRRVVELEPKQCKYLITLCEQVCWLLKFVGVLNEPVLSMELILENAARIDSAYALSHPEAGPTLSFVTEGVEMPETPLSVELLYIDFLKLGSVTIGYYGLAHVVGTRSEGKIEWKSENLTLKSMTQLHSLPQQYEQLKETAQKETGCKNAIARPFEQ